MGEQELDFSSMALTLVNHFYWQIPEAKVPFMIADVCIVVAMRYVEKGIAAEKKLAAIKGDHAAVKGEMDKGEKLGRKNKLLRQQQQKQQSNNGGKFKKMNTTIQQPSKRD